MSPQDAEQFYPQKLLEFMTTRKLLVIKTVFKQPKNRGNAAIKNIISCLTISLAAVYLTLQQSILISSQATVS